MQPMTVAPGRPDRYIRPMAWARVATPWGEFYARAEGPNIVALQFPGPPPGELAPPPPVLVRLARELGEYFRGTRTTFDLPLLLRGTKFQIVVWEELRRVPYGTTVTYGELARRVGRPRSARAVGGAMEANPLPILVPCHRVLPVAEGLGGFGPGSDWKRRLLALEGTPLPAS